MAKDGEYGDHEEIFAWSNLRQRAVRVFKWVWEREDLEQHVVRPLSCTGEEVTGGQEEEVKLLLLNEHYWLLRRLEDQEEPPESLESCTPRSLQQEPTAGPPLATNHQDQSRQPVRLGVADRGPSIRLGVVDKGKLGSTSGVSSYGGRSSARHTSTKWMMRRWKKGGIGGPPMPVATEDEKLLFVWMLGSPFVRGNFAKMARYWNALIALEVGYVLEGEGGGYGMLVGATVHGMCDIFGGGRDGNDSSSLRGVQ